MNETSKILYVIERCDKMWRSDRVNYWDYFADFSVSSPNNNATNQANDHTNDTNDPNDQTDLKNWKTNHANMLYIKKISDTSYSLLLFDPNGSNSFKENDYVLSRLTEAMESIKEQSNINFMIDRFQDQNIHGTFNKYGIGQGICGGVTWLIFILWMHFAIIIKI